MRKRAKPDIRERFGFAIKKRRPGQKVKLTVDAYGRDYTGTIERIAGALDMSLAELFRSVES